MLASLTMATQNMWPVEAGASITSELVPLFPEAEETIPEKNLQKKCPLSFSNLTYWTDCHADATKLLITFTATNVGKQYVICCIYLYTQ